MSDPTFKIGAEGVDAEKIVSEIRTAVQEKMDKGIYNDARIARAERTNLVNLQKEDGFLTFYLKCLREAAFVDTSDFEIRERRRFMAPILVPIKKVIWQLLKFYTYRLWSQQNEVNGLMVTAIEGMDEKYEGKVDKLEKRVQELEKQLGARAR